jgi:hypothetical protein
MPSSGDAVESVVARTVSVSSAATGSAVDTVDRAAPHDQAAVNSHASTETVLTRVTSAGLMRLRSGGRWLLALALALLAVLGGLELADSRIRGLAAARVPSGRLRARPDASRAPPLC